MNKSKNFFEIHCIKVQEIYQEYTTHQSIIVNDKTYMYYPVLKNYPFKKNDKMILICRSNKNGTYNVEAIFNKITGKKVIPYKLLRFFSEFFVIVFSPILLIISVILMGGKLAIFIAYILIISWIGSLLWLSYTFFFNFKYYKLAIKTVLSIENIKDRKLVEQHLKNFSGTSFISDDF